MSEQSLAVKYRPSKFEDVVEQGSVVEILKNQLTSGGVQHSYLFCGGAGTGKTTCARIFANEINNGIGTPYELDAASNNSVEDVRIIIEQSRQLSIDGSAYRVYIIDECHMLSNSAWNAMLKLLEEPPATAIFIFCTTDPQKIPKTIKSRVQRYDFQRISQQGIVDRLKHILTEEQNAYKYNSGVDSDIEYDKDALEYIAKIADGGMRDAITMLDKCLAYSTDLTIENVIKAIGTVDFSVFFDLNESIVDKLPKQMFETIEKLHADGKDLKLFIRTYTDFVLDLCKYDVTGALTYTQIPGYYDEKLAKLDVYYFAVCNRLLKKLISLNSVIKWDSNPKTMIEASLFEMCAEDDG